MTFKKQTMSILRSIYIYKYKMKCYWQLKQVVRIVAIGIKWLNYICGHFHLISVQKFLYFRGCKQR
jgi:hypothetical protein